MSSSKTLLVVGAGFGQIPAIKKAKKMDIRVVTVDKNPDAPGMALADKAYEIDVLNKEAILSVARTHRVNGIMTLQSDFGIPAVGYVNDQMNLTGISYETAITCSDKKECRLKLAEKNCAQPKFRFVKSIDEARKAVVKLGFPCVIKAPDSSGSRGVVKVNQLDEIKDALNEAFKNSKQDSVIIEEFIDGLEFGAQTFSINGNCEMVLMHNDTLSQAPYMIPIGHSFPFTDLNQDQSIQAIKDIKDAVVALGIHDGPANIDLILDKKSKRVNVIEVGARIGATCLPELVEYHTGIDWIKESIKSAMDINPDLSIKKKESVAALIVQSPKDGTYKGHTIKCKPSDYNVIEYEITAKFGEKVNKLRKGTDRIGKVITSGSNTKEAERNSKEFLSSIEISVD